MKNGFLTYSIYSLLTVFLLTSCYTIEHLPIDYMESAQVNFPPQIKRVGVVNNMSSTPDNQIEEPDTLKKTAYEIVRKVNHYNGDPVLATQSLAEAIAEQDYFDTVIILDSALRARDYHPRESILSQKETIDLAEKMDVDLLVALENLQIKTTRIISIMPGMGYWGTIDAKISPSIRLYIPQRSLPLVEINASDTIFWEDTSYSEARLNTRYLPEEEIIKEASNYSGNIPIKYFIPYWKTEYRHLYTGGNSQMRDALYLALNNNWEKACEIWKRIYDKKGERKKPQMYAAFNMALYYEVNDNLTAAIEWAQKAAEIAKKKEEYKTIFQNDTYVSVSNRELYASYISKLEKRKEDSSKLRIQMERFNEDF